MPAIQTPKTTPIRVPISREVMAQATVLNPNISPHAQMCFHKTQATKLANLSILTRFRPFCKFAKRRQSPKRHAYHISNDSMAVLPHPNSDLSCDPRAHFLRSQSFFPAIPKLLSCNPKELSCAPRAPFLRISISLQWANATNPRLPIKKRTSPALYSKANDSCANSSFDEFSVLFLCFRLRAWR